MRNNGPEMQFASKTISFSIISMATWQIREVPSDLPCARLYLDDITEIERILTSAFGVDAGVSFEYIVGETLRITTLEELLAHGGYTTQFQLVLVMPRLGYSGLPRRNVVLEFRAGTIWNSEPRFRCPYDLENREFDLYARLLQIFQGRSMKITNALKALPAWITTTCYVIFLGCLFAPSSVTGHALLSMLLLSFAVFSGVVLISGFLLANRKSRVNFTRHREDTLAKKQRRDERLEKLIWLFVGSLIGCASTIIIQHFKH